jgi:hypothetical protein
MKKTYQKPETDIIRIELQQIVALSRGDGFADPSGKVLSRRYNVWDEEFEYGDYGFDEDEFEF